MAVIRPEKVAKVAEIQELLSNSKCTILVDFCGLTVAQDTELRRKMREAGVHYNVVKNTLLRIAAEQAGIEGLEPSLEKKHRYRCFPGRSCCSCKNRLRIRKRKQRTES